MDLHARARGQEQSPAHRGSERSRASLEPGLVDEPPPLVSSPLCLGPCRLVQPLPPPAGARPFLFQLLPKPLAAAPSGAFSSRLFLFLVVAKDRAQDFRIRDSPRSRFAVLAAPRKCRRHHEFPHSPRSAICSGKRNVLGILVGNFGGKIWRQDEESSRAAGGLQ